jgi:hypothetical protein
MPTIEWSPARRVAFRFAAVYISLYIVPIPLYLLPTERVAEWWNELWAPLVKWTGLHVFGVTITVLPNGSGDTTFNYVQLFCFAVIAAAAAVVWSALDRRPNDDALHHALRVCVRYAVAATMLGYGAAKVIQAQFLPPSLDRLVQPFGSASPMGLLWTFMGASAAYNLFTGLGEVVGGLLLTARRTTSLGALVCLAVMSNVAVLNLAYDVPVKLFSLHLVAMSLFLLLPDLGRLANVLVLNRPTAAIELRPRASERWRRLAPALRTAFFLALLLSSLSQARQVRAIYAQRSPFRGIWNVEEFALDGQTRPVLLDDATRWRRVVFDRRGSFGVHFMNDDSQRFVMRLDDSRRTMTIWRFTEPAKRFTLAYINPTSAVMTLEGELDGKKVRALLRRTETPSFLLTSRGFHWISEYPFNR